MTLLVILELPQLLKHILQFEHLLEQVLPQHELVQTFSHEDSRDFEGGWNNEQFSFERENRNAGVEGVLGLQTFFLPQPDQELVFDEVLYQGGLLFSPDRPDDLHVDFEEVILEAIDQEEARDYEEPVQLEKGLLGPSHLILLNYKALFIERCFSECPACTE